MLRTSKSETNEQSGSSIASSSSPLSVSSTANLIKPMESESSISSSSTATSSMTATVPAPAADEENLESYKNDLYRSSHQIIYKQQLFQQGAANSLQKPHLKTSSTGVVLPSTSLLDSGGVKASLGLLYEAKPLNMAMWTSANSAITSSLAAAERDQMIDRLSAAIANLNNSICSNTVKSSEHDEHSEDGTSSTSTSNNRNTNKQNEVRQISCVWSSHININIYIRAYYQHKKKTRDTNWINSKGPPYTHIFVYIQRRTY